MAAKPLPKFPVPEVENLRKMSLEQALNEFVTLRDFTGQLFLWCKDYISQGEMPGGAVARFNAIEKQMLQYPLSRDLQIFIDGHNKQVVTLNAQIAELEKQLNALIERVTSHGLAINDLATYHN